MIEHINIAPIPPEPEPRPPMPDREVPEPENDPWGEPDEGDEKVSLPPGIDIPVRMPELPLIHT